MTPPSPNPRRRRLLIGIAAVVVLALVVAGLYFTGTSDHSNKATNRAIGANVAVSGNNVSDGLKAKKVTGTSLPIEAATSLGPVVDITPGGKLPAPTTLRFQLAPQVAANTTVFVAWRSTPADEWDVRQATVSADGKFASIITDHLSWYWPFSVSIGDIFNGVKKEVLSALTGESSEHAEQPKCANEAAARKDNYKIDSNGTAALYWCFGVEKVDGRDQRIVRITNRLRYPIRMTHQGFHVPKEAKYQAAYQAELSNLARLSSGDHTILFPFDSITYTTDLGVNEGAKIVTEFDGYAQSLYRMDIALNTLALIIAKLGGKAMGKTAHERWKALDEVLGDVDCYNAVESLNFGGALVKCFDPGKLKKLFDWRGVLLSPLITAGSLFNWIRSEVNSQLDQFNNRSKYVVLVTRANLSDKFVGEWHVHGMNTTFKADGTGKVIQNNGPCNYGHLCTGYMDLQWKMDGDKLVYTITSYKSVDETGAPEFDIGTAGEVVGKSASVAYVRTGFLRVTSLAPDLLSSHYLCGKGVNNTDLGECGA